MGRTPTSAAIGAGQSRQWPGSSPLCRLSPTRLLHVGAGIGRLSLAHARAGLEVVATDAGNTGLVQLTPDAREDGLHVETQVAPFTGLPVERAGADHVLAWNVIDHQDGEIVAVALSDSPPSPWVLVARGN